MGAGGLKLIDVVEDMCVEKNISFKPMRFAEDIMNPDVKTLTLDHTVKNCLDFMEGCRIRHVPIVDSPGEGEKKPYFIGIVSQRDVLRLNTPDIDESGKAKVDQRALRQLLVQIVARNPRSAKPKTPALDVISAMTSNHIDVVPVLDGKDLVGIITSTDIIKLFIKLDKLISQISPELKKGMPSEDTSPANLARLAILSSWISRTVEEIMSEPAICLDPQDDVAGAIKLLQNGGFRHAPVTDEQGKLVGIISDRDILRHLPFAGKRPLMPPKTFREHLFAVRPQAKSLHLPVQKIMTRKVKTVSPACSLCEAVDIISRKKISSLPVVDGQGNLQAIVTLPDLMRGLLAAYEPAEKAGLVPSSV